MFYTPSPLLAFLVRLSVWYAFSVFKKLCDDFSFSLSHQRKRSLLALVYSLPYVFYLTYLESRSVLMRCDHQTIKDISGSYDTLVELFESFESFLRRLEIYTKMPHTTAMTEVIIKIIIELLAALALATQQAKQGPLSMFHPSQCNTY